MPRRNNIAVSTGGQSPSTAGGLMSFSNEVRAVISQALVRLMYAKSYCEVLECICTVEVGQHGCALYSLPQTGQGLHLLCGVGDYKRFVPPLISKGSKTYRDIMRTASTDSAGKACQASLFDDYPQILFIPILQERQLIGAIACVHNVSNSDVLRFILKHAQSLPSLQNMDRENMDILSPPELASSNNETRTTGSPRHVAGGRARLTARETEVLRLMVSGRTTRAIADELFISTVTCRHHIEHILAKLEVHSRAAAVAAWLRELTPTPPQ